MKTCDICMSHLLSCCWLFHPIMHADAKVSGFPTIKMMSGGDYIDYSGDRSKADLIKFVKANAKSEAGAEDEKDEL